ncbi:cation diffusion facilitator family transporter [Sporosarcina sp. P1]|uniref:cation diffusion facilitator family transporter n=1 Tax=Sporosarcina sp. P1 TaxID=2048257 RepID=UPI000C1692FC|nr:cation diffusion facilitator family transporter [Sporosarcina sp. P1]PIC83662.1 transporter [Sporosarcina sp. P1]
MDEQKYNDLKLGEKGAYLSIVAYICLSILKLIIGYLSGSEALKADGLNNTTDIVASITVLIGLRLSRKPADKNHKYGHWKSETIASMVASFIMMAVGIQVLFSTIISFADGGKESPDIMAGYVGIFSFLVMYFVYRYNKKLALKINSQAVMAAAKDNISDAWVSIGTAIGIFGSQLNMPWLDTLTALIVGSLICKTAWDIFREASHDLSDGFDENQIEVYKNTIQLINEVQEIKEIKGRNYGNNAVVDIVILVQPNLSLEEAHDISTLVENTLKEKDGVYDVHVHVEPNSNGGE